ncbi:DinB family protein [Pseudonocardia abyssalis]|uniref:DinB family protein n=1 Tax=Pseudonocardia abyssalis TaxID=2792008 RepID=A0ABS6V219_9PSEU|nr:DinB family protein [Pseudonocardia abyssalis]MBW0119556.1 DinB family protein [Pseudonocardia abyssalis]MBW0138029.1 DinB family protein [Pseudonocardia abyssalis]
MPPSHARPPVVADERTQLVGWLDLQRALVRWKCAGLTDEQARRAVLPGSPLMTVAGLVSHLRWTEHCWFEVLFLGGPSAGNPQFDTDVEDADMRPDGVPLARLLDEFDAQWARSDEIVAAHSLDDTGRHPDFSAGAASLRWILLHMLEETARHVGHLDTIREQLDGVTGYY